MNIYSRGSGWPWNIIVNQYPHHSRPLELCSLPLSLFLSLCVFLIQTSDLSYSRDGLRAEKLQKKQKTARVLPWERGWSLKAHTPEQTTAWLMPHMHFPPPCSGDFTWIYFLPSITFTWGLWCFSKRTLKKEMNSPSNSKCRNLDK